MGTRRAGRELAVQALYRTVLAGEGDAVDAVFWDQFAADTPETVAFAKTLVAGVLSEAARIDQLIASAAEHWRPERIAVVDRCVLRVATYEFLAERSTPISVVIDEAVEIARRFGGDGSGSFVNGVLDHVARIARNEVEEVPAGERR